MGSGYDTVQVWRQIDFAAIHTYAYWDSGYGLWDWQKESADESVRTAAMMNAALDHAQMWVSIFPLLLVKRDGSVSPERLPSPIQPISVIR